jgi:hypothetical protein
MAHQCATPSETVSSRGNVQRGLGHQPRTSVQAVEIPRKLRVTRSACQWARGDTNVRRLRWIGVGALITFALAGCASSPEASRVRGEPGADPGNHGNPVELVAPPDRFERVFYGIPYDGPSVAQEDTAES